MSPVEGNPSLNDESATDDSQSMHEAQLNAAMKRLKLIHVKSRLLRDIIPRIIEPLVQRHPSPDVMFNAFTKGVSDAQMEIKEFVDLMRDKESKQVFAQADKSREVNPFGIKPWKHHDYPDWFRIDKE